MQLKSLGQCVTYFKGYPFKSEWYTSFGKPIVKVSDFTDDGIDINNLSHIKQEVAETYKRYAINTGDIIIQTVGSWPDNPKSVVGKVVRADVKIDGALLNQNAVNLIPNNNINKIFLYYLLKSELFKGYIINTAQGSANQASITLSSILDYKFFLPTLQIQECIGSCLDAYGNLIEINKQRIIFLEQTCRDLYREWFIRMRFPGHKNSKFEKGIPENWHIDNCYSFSDVKGGGTPSTTNPIYWQGEINFFTPTDHSDSFFIMNTEKKITTKGLNESSTKLFPQYSTFITARGTVGNICLAGEEMAMNQSCFGIVSIDKDDRLFTFLFADLMVKYLKQVASGVTFDAITLNTFKNYKTPIPNKELRTQFATIIKPFFLQIEGLIKQNIQLCQIRDRLLPRLISGKIKIKTDEKNQ